MRNYLELVENLKKHKLIKQNMNELPREHVYTFLMTFSKRLDAIEDFVSENTDYDGKKVSNPIKYGTKKEDLLK